MPKLFSKRLVVKKFKTMKITHKQLRQIILEACGCGSSPESDSLGNFSDLSQTNIDHDEAFSAGCSVCGAPSGKCGHDHEQVDVDWEHPDYGHMRGDINDMDPEDAFALGFAMGQSGEFDDTVEPPTVEDAFYPEEVEARKGAWSGGDNIEDPLNHTYFETGESNAGPHVRTGGCAMREMKITRRQLRQIIKEELSRLNENEQSLEGLGIQEIGDHIPRDLLAGHVTDMMMLAFPKIRDDLSYAGPAKIHDFGQDPSMQSGAFGKYSFAITYGFDMKSADKVQRIWDRKIKGKAGHNGEDMDNTGNKVFKMSLAKRPYETQDGGVELMVKIALNDNWVKERLRSAEA